MADAERKLRLFVAISASEEAQAELRRAADAMRPFAPSDTRWVDPSGAHLTLRFIGATPPDAADAVGEAVAQAASNAAPFALTLAGAGVFPERGAPRVLWVGVAGELDALASLQRKVADALNAMDVPQEPQPAFRPHFTVGRIGVHLPRQEAQELREAVAAVGVEPAALAVEEIGVYRSDMRPSGAVYSRIASADLGG